MTQHDNGNTSQRTAAIDPAGVEELEKTRVRLRVERGEGTEAEKLWVDGLITWAELGWRVAYT